MLKLVAFDLDGTIGDTLPMCIKAFRKAISPYAGRSLCQDEIVQTFGLNEAGMVKAVISENWEMALNDFYKVYKDMHKECDKPYDGIRDLLFELKAKGIKVALITGKGENSCQITLEQFGLTNFFADVITGSENGNVKAASISYLLKKYNLSSDECVYVGDTVSDVEESEKANVICLSVLWGTTADKENLNKKNPDYLFYTVDDLRKFLTGLSA